VQRGCLSEKEQEQQAGSNEQHKMSRIGIAWQRMHARLTSVLLDSQVAMLAAWLYSSCKLPPAEQKLLRLSRAEKKAEVLGLHMGLAWESTYDRPPPSACTKSSAMPATHIIQLSTDEMTAAAVAAVLRQQAVSSKAAACK
jgi:hypothetical protein